MTFCPITCLQPFLAGQPCSSEVSVSHLASVAPVTVYSCQYTAVESQENIAWSPPGPHMKMQPGDGLSTAWQWGDHPLSRWKRGGFTPMQPHYIRPLLWGSIGASKRDKSIRQRNQIKSKGPCFSKEPTQPWPSLVLRVTG